MTKKKAIEEDDKSTVTLTIRIPSDVMDSIHRKVEALTAPGVRATANAVIVAVLRGELALDEKRSR